MARLNKKGFFTIEVAVVVLLICLVIAAGALIDRKYHAPSQSANSSSSN